MTLSRKGTPLTEAGKQKLKEGRARWLEKHRAEKQAKKEKEMAYTPHNLKSEISMDHPGPEIGGDIRASSTTLNIQGPVVATEPDPRLPAPDPLIEALLAANSAEVVSEPPTEPKSETINVPLKMLTDMQIQIEELKAIKTVTGESGGMTFEQLAYLLKEMKKPDEETQKKIDEEKQRRALDQKNMMELALFEEARKNEREANCSHTKENGRPAWVGQQHSDGLIHPICCRCFKADTPYRPKAESMAMGLS